MLRTRNNHKELIDHEDIPKEDLYRNLKELHTVNQFLGGYAITLNALKKVKRPVKVLVDIGCGGGHMLQTIQKKRNDIQLHGVDIKTDCINYSRKNCAGSGIQFVKADFKNVFEHVPDADLVHACLFMHHFSNEEVSAFIKSCLAKNVTVVINDLERNVLAYGGIRLLTSVFSKSYLVKNDAPLSVSRGFKKKEWQKIMEDAGAKDYQISNKWAFRHQVIVHG